MSTTAPQTPGKKALSQTLVSHGRWMRDGRFYGVFTRVTFADGSKVEFSGRLTKREALASAGVSL